MRIENLALIFVFFPYVGFIKGIDLQPFYLVILMVIFTTNLLKGRILNKSKTLVFAILITLFLATLRYLFEYSFEYRGGNHNVFISCASHLLTGTLVVLLFPLLKDNISIKFLKSVTAVYIIVGLIQLFINEKFLSFLVFRGYQDLLVTSRGMRSLSSEPSVLSYTLIILNALYIFKLSEEKKITTKVILRASSVFVLANIVISQSLFGIFIHILPFLYYLLRRKVLLFFLTFTVGYYAFLKLLTLDLDFRSINLIKALANNPESLLIEGAMKKLFNIPISILTSLKFGLLGSGFLDVKMINLNLEIFPKFPMNFEVGNKNSGGLIELFLQIGFLSIFLFFTIGRKFISLLRHKNNISLLLILVWIVTGFSYNSYGNPMHWILLSFIFNIQSNNFEKRNSYSMQ